MYEKDKLRNLQQGQSVNKNFNTREGQEVSQSFNDVEEKAVNKELNNGEQYEVTQDFSARKGQEVSQKVINGTRQAGITSSTQTIRSSNVEAITVMVLVRVCSVHTTTFGGASNHHSFRVVLGQ